MNPARILYVEDDDDIRDTMTMLLEHEGYHVVALPTAEAALDQLARGTFDLLLTDYQLPHQNAEWLIERAQRRGHLGNTAVIVLSGALAPTGIDGYRLLRKPVGQETLLAAFDDAMRERTPAPPPEVNRDDAELRLVLYVSGQSQASRKARRNLALALRGVAEEQVEITVHDLTGADRTWEGGAEEDRIVVLPTLVRRAPAPKVWIAGDLSDLAVVRDAIVPAWMQAPRSERP